MQGPQPTHQAPPWSQITLFLFTVAVIILCALILQPLFAATVGAIVLAVATQHPYDWLASKIRNRNLCAVVALLIVIIAIILPSVLLSQEIVDQAINTVNAFRHDASHERFFAFLARHPDLTARVQSITDSIDVDETIKNSAAFLGRHLFQILGSSVVVITELVFLLFILFFLFRDRDLALTFAAPSCPSETTKPPNSLPASTTPSKPPRSAASPSPPFKASSPASPTGSSEFPASSSGPSPPQSSP